MIIKAKIVTIFVIIFILCLIIAFPNISKDGVSQGLITSTSVIIPSLFPFLVCVFLLMKNRINIKSNFANKVLYKLFGHNLNLFFVFVLSMIGGYTVGAALINEMYNQKVINNKTADIMLTYCVNAGPAFIVIIAGGSFGSRVIGIILLSSHVISSIMIALLLSKQLRKEVIYQKPLKNSKSFLTIFIESVAAACDSIIKICSFVIVFSVINSYLEYLLINMPILKNITLFTEVTSAVTKCKNIYLVSFLLGFSGLSIWCQVLSLCTNRKTNLKQFIFGRLLHGATSSIITYVIIKFCKINITTFSNNISFIKKFVILDSTLFISIAIMLIILFISVFSKNNCRKIINDVL